MNGRFREIETALDEAGAEDFANPTGEAYFKIELKN
jgi:hypothetical protein